jgi:membrane dipeptidase
MAEAATIERAREILRGAPLIDGHNDLLWELRKRVRYDLSKLDPADAQPELMTDFARLREGAVGGQFWSVYVPSDLVARHPDTLEFATTADDVERIAAAGRVASLIGMEGGQSIGSSLGALRAMAALGARYMTLTHFNNNPWADSATDDAVHGGLSRFGEEVVREMNREGMLVDLSHVSADTMRHAIKVSEAPPFFSHSSARALCDVTRNVPDDVLETVGRRGGVVMVAFVPSFVVPEGAEAMIGFLAELKRLEKEHPGDTAAVEAGLKVYEETHPEPKSAVADVANHIDHIRDVAGVDHIGVGSDYDGTSGMPEGLEDVSTYPNLFGELLDRGYSDEDCAKIAGRNALRVMRESEKVAERIRGERGPSNATIEELDVRV